MTQYTNAQFAAFINASELFSGLPTVVGNGAITQFNALGWSACDTQIIKANSTGLEENVRGGRITVYNSVFPTVPPIPGGLTTSQAVLEAEVSISGADFWAESGANTEIGRLGWPVGYGGIAGRAGNSVQLAVYGAFGTDIQLLSPNPGFAPISHHATDTHNITSIIAGSGRGH